MYKQKKPAAKKRKRSKRKVSASEKENKEIMKQQLARKSTTNLTNITNQVTEREGELLILDESCASLGDGQLTQANVLALNRI